MKRKLLFAALCVVSVLVLRAQTDVTSTYLTNADFSQTTALTSTYLYGYDKDGSPCNFQSVDGWTSVVTATNTSGTSKGGYAGGVFAYGSSTHLKGNDMGAPSADPDNQSGNCLGFFSVWGAGGYYYQEVTLQPGAYTINIPVYNQSGTSTTTTYFGWTPDEGTASTMATPTSTGSWQTLTTSFTLESATKGQIRIGYKSNGSGSGANPHLFIDKVQILCSPFATDDDYTALNTAISAVGSKKWGFDAGEYAPYNYAEVIRALAEAKAINQEANNSQATVQALTATLNTTMTANTAEVNAIWDPSFEHGYSTSGNVQPIAWTGTSGHDNATDVRWMWNVSSNAGLAATSSSKALFTKYGVHYGQQVGYTLPLNASTYYTLSFKYGGWSDCKKDGYVTMTDPASASLSILASNRLPLDAVDGNSNTASWKNYSAFFKTNDAGNYILGLRKDNESQQSQYVYGDFVLKATTIDEATAFYTTAKAAVEGDYDADANGGSEKAAFKAALDASVPSTVAEIMEAAANLYTLRDAFVAATPKYDAFVAAKTAENPSLSYAAEAKLTALTTAKAASATSSSDAVTKTAAITAALRAYYESNAMAEGVPTAVDYSTAVSAANADTNTGWTNGVGIKNGDEPYTNSDGTTATKYLDGGWAEDAAANVDMTRTVEIPAGTYLLTVKARGAVDLTEYTLSIAGETINLPHANGGSNGVFGNGWEDASVEFESDGTAQTLEVVAKSTANQQWFSMNDFRLVKLDATLATAEDYENLNTAISTAEAKTLGFDEGEYAPYNNVEALTKLAEAKAINQSANNVQEDVRTITDALNGFSWTVNASDVDAIYNGNFALSTANETSGSNLDIPGWTPNGSIRQVIENGVNGTFPALAETTGGKAMFTWSGTFVYGEQSGYELPLNAHTIYELSFKHAGWNGSNNNFYVKVTDDEGAVLPQQTCGKSNNGPQTAGCWNTYTIIFVTGNGGNHKLSMIPSGNSAFTDVTLSKAASQTLTFAEDGSTPKFASGTYPTVSLARTFSTANYSTLVLPFAMDADETADAFAEAYTLSGVEGESLKFSTADVIDAGTPYLVKANAAKLSVTGKAIDPATTVTNTVVKSTDELTTATFVGTFAGVNLPSTNTDAWVVSNNNLYNVNSDVTVGAYRGYFTVETAGGVKALNLDLEGADGIGALRNAENETMGNAIFNLAGQRINKLQKGVNIINGKKVLVK